MFIVSVCAEQSLDFFKVIRYTAPLEPGYSSHCNLPGNAVLTVLVAVLVIVEPNVDVPVDDPVVVTEDVALVLAVVDAVEVADDDTEDVTVLVCVVAVQCRNVPST